MNYAVEYFEPGQGGALPPLLPGAKADRDEWYTIFDARTEAEVGIQRSCAGHPDRERVQGFIRDVYFAVHAASLNAFMPELFTIYEADGTPSASIGLRRIGEAPIFLEKYLDIAVEHSVQQITGQPIARQRIAEVGNLASVSAGAGRHLIAFLVYHLAATGVDWAVCTGTNAVRAALRRMGVEFELIRKARGECMGDDLVNWGSYYQHNPFVIAVNIADGVRSLQQSYRYRKGAP